MPALRVVLVLLGVTSLSLGPLMLFWPAGWRWSPYQPHYEQMMVGLYFMLGVFLIRASKDPLRHLSLIWFMVWSSLAHASIMAVQSFTAPEHHGHLVGDVPALFLGAAVLAFLTRRLERTIPSLPAQGT
jgi:hypothetical protein